MREKVKRVCFPRLTDSRLLMKHDLLSLAFYKKPWYLGNSAAALVFSGCVKHRAWDEELKRTNPL